MLLSASNKVRNRILTSNDTTLVSLFNSWRDKREYISKLYRLSNVLLEKKNLELDSIITSANENEERPDKSFRNFQRQEYEKNKVSWVDVKVN